MSQTRALLVALTEYHPASKVSPLSGCVNDILDFKKYLIEDLEVPDNQIITLKNEQVTRANFEAQFLQIAETLQSGDRFVFYYAGHGSYNTTAPEFAGSDGAGQDETMVLYDTRLAGNHDLSDKEFAWLLAQIPDGVEVIVVMDSCHSANITRSVYAEPQLAHKRFTDGVRRARKLSDYTIAGKEIYQTSQTGAPLRAAVRSHLVLSACQRDQEAWETTDRRGLFSSLLLQSLRETSGRLSYYELQQRIHARMQRITDKQQPYLDAQGVPPDRVFLRNEERPNNRGQQHQVFFKRGHWCIDTGAVHGIPNNSSQPIKVAIYREDDPEKVYALSTVESVQINHCVLNFEEGNTRETFIGVFQHLPNALLFGLSGDARLQEDFRKAFRKLETPNVGLGDAETAPFTVALRPEGMSIVGANGTVLYDAPNHEPRHVNKMFVQRMSHIERYERLRTLQHPTSRLDASDFEVQLRVDGQSFSPGEAIALSVAKTDQGKWARLPFNFVASNHSDRPLHVAVMAMYPDFEIASITRTREIKPGATDIEISDHATNQLGLLETENFIQDYFRVIVATEPFDSEVFPQRSIKVKTRRGFHAEPEPVDDWRTFQFDVSIVGTTANIGDNDVELPGFTLKKNDALRAQVGTNALQSATRSLQNFDRLAVLTDQLEGLEFVNFAPSTRSIDDPARDQRIIELNGIENAEDLRDNPLEIKVNGSTEENFIPVTFDGEFLLPVGRTVVSEDGKRTIRVDELPEQRGRRSLGRAAWFAVLRTIGFAERTFLLRRVSGFKTKKGGIVAVREKGNIAHYVKSADKILLCIHGIIGDAAGIANELQPTFDSGRYDLLLTFDYECLMSGIEETAKVLHRLLEEAGLGPKDGKTFDIIAHSMGGLVSRYMIEHLQHGNDTVDRLAMFGTPNGGSAFGEIPKYRDILTTLMTVALNYGRFFVGPISVALDSVNGFLLATKPVTKTLAQMAVDSKFLKELNRPPTTDFTRHTEYTVVAGDISNYTQSEEDSKLARLIDRALTRVGDLAYATPNNDIAVATSKIREVETQRAITVVCHHLNYFIHPAGIVELNKWLDAANE